MSKSTAYDGIGRSQLDGASRASTTCAIASRCEAKEGTGKSNLADIDLARRSRSKFSGSTSLYDEVSD